MRLPWILLGALICTGLMQAPAHADKRVALVIGNGAYERADKLANPITDARRMREVLSSAKLGFDVVYGENLGKQQIERMIGRFANAVQDADVAVVYFAGHGATFGDVPYVVPVDAQFSSLGEVPYELVPVETLIGELRRAKGLRIAILDACRDDSAERELKQVSLRGGEVSRGLARVKNPEGLILAYATQYLSTAADGDPSGDSPFTAALLHHIATPGLDVKDLFYRVGAEVIASTMNRQRPELAISFYDSYALVPGPAATPAMPAPPVPDAALAEGQRLLQQVEAAGFDRAKLAELLRSCGTSCPANIVAQSQRRLDLIAAEERIYQSARSDIDKLYAYLKACEACNFKGEATERAQLLTRLMQAGNNLAALQRFLGDCGGGCPSDLRSRIQSRIDEVRQQVARGEDQTYQQARGKADLLRNYAKDCVICAHRSDADQEASRLEYDAKFFMLKVCNKSTRRASVAVMGRVAPDGDDWHVQGWWTVPEGQCSSLKKFVKGTIYLFAQEYGNSAYAWKGNGPKLCVDFPGPFDRVNRDGYNCRSSEKPASFSSFNVSDETFTWDLNR
jgi:uncharacterized caspase-like protein